MSLALLEPPKTGFIATMAISCMDPENSIRRVGVVLTTCFLVINVFHRGLLLIRKFSQGFYFRETWHIQSFVKIKSSRNVEITLSFSDLGRSCPSREF